MRIWIHNKFQWVIGIFDVSGIPRLDLELAHSCYEGLGTVKHVFVYGETIEGKFIFAETA